MKIGVGWLCLVQKRKSFIHLLILRNRPNRKNTFRTHQSEIGRLSETRRDDVGFRYSLASDIGTNGDNYACQIDFKCR